ncbi:MAG: RNA polymerase sigma factor [Firmicutes bacterium]|nr:RNA polymerase sigma factor [Bacillota bacterium]
MEAFIFNDLLERVAKSDQAAFTTIYNAYCKRVKWVAFSVVGDLNYAEDVVSEVFLKLWDGQNKYVKNPNAWIYEITRNAALDLYRKHIKKGKNAVSLEALCESGATPAAEDSFSLTEFQSMIASFDKTDQEILTKKLAFSYTFPEIAAEVRLSVGAVFKRYQKCLEKLKNIFESR